MRGHRAGIPATDRTGQGGRELLRASGADLDYFERVDSTTFEADPAGDLLIVAARVGTTRLIDNLVLTPALPLEDT